MSKPMEPLDDQLFHAAKSGNVAAVAAILDEHPDKLFVRDQPYEHTLLHVAAFAGHLPVVDLLLNRGLDVNAREKGDNTYPMHWAAAAGHLDIVRRLADAGGDVVGRGDDHKLEVIGWTTCWEGGDDDIHRAIADFLLSRGARHHIFSAMALDLPDEVRRIVAENPAALSTTQSHNEDFQRPLHFAVRTNRARMVKLLLELGADPLSTDGTGHTTAAYAMTPTIDLPVMAAMRALGKMDLVTALALHDWEAADQLLRKSPGLIRAKGPTNAPLHLMAKRGDVAGVRWLLDHGADPSELWNHWDAELTPLHLAVLADHVEIVSLLVEAGADKSIRDSKHESDPLGWAEFFGRGAIVQALAR